MPEATPGQKFRVRADEWNAMREAARALSPRFGGDGSQSGLGPGLVFVRNSGETTLALHAVVGLSGSGRPVSSSEFRSDAPVARCHAVFDPAEPFAILLQPLEPGETGLARYEGFLTCRIRFNAERQSFYYATPVANQTYLVGSDSGPVSVLDYENVSDENGLRWALILLKDRGSYYDSADVVLCKVLNARSDSGDWTQGVNVAIYGDGPLLPATGQGVVYCPEVGQSAKPIPTSLFIAHRSAVYRTCGTLPDEEQ